MGVLTEEERESITSEARATLEQQHSERLAVLDRKRKHRRKRHGDRPAPDARENEVTELQRKIREDFYREMNYTLYKDSTGREHWLSQEEYEHRLRRKRRKRKHRIASLERWSDPRFRTVLIYLALAFTAVGVGLLLVSRT